MRFALIVSALGLVIGGAGYLASLPLALAAAVAIAACIAASSLVSGRASSLSIAAGALAAVALSALSPSNASAAAALAMATIFLPRTIRARTDTMRGLAFIGSLVAGASAGAIAAHYAHAPDAVLAAAALVAALIAALPLLVPADDAVAWSLAMAAPNMRRICSSKASLLKAVALRRRVDGDIEGLGATAHGRLKRAWSALEAAARARVLARGASADVLDQRITSHVDALERAYAAADERFARTAGLDDKALRNVNLEADSLAAEASALAELADAPPVAQEASST